MTTRPTLTAAQEVANLRACRDIAHSRWSEAEIAAEQAQKLLDLMFGQGETTTDCNEMVREATRHTLRIDLSSARSSSEIWESAYNSISGNLQEVENRLRGERA